MQRVSFYSLAFLYLRGKIFINVLNSVTLLAVADLERIQCSWRELNLMKSLSNSELLYLFYAFAYTEGDPGSVTQGTVKKYLPKPYIDQASEICKSLKDKKLLESPKFSRVSVSDYGKKILVEQLQITDYRFTTNKGSRVVNALVNCLQIASSGSSRSSSEMQFEDFVGHFKDFYFEERAHQSSKGTYVIREKEILSSFAKQHQISEDLLDFHYKRLQREGLISVVDGRSDKNLQWVE